MWYNPKDALGCFVGLKRKRVRIPYERVAVSGIILVETIRPHESEPLEKAFSLRRVRRELCLRTECREVGRLAPCFLQLC